MIKRDIASRYSKALFNLDSASGSLEKRLTEFDNFLEIIKKNPKFWTFLRAPQITLEEKEQVLSNTLKNIFDPRFLQFLFCVLEKGRLYYLPFIASEYRRMVDESLGIWEAKLVTAVPIHDDLKEQLRKKMENHYHKKILFNEKVNPRVIGGAFLVVAHHMIDWSIKGRIRKLKENLLADDKG